MVIYQGLISKIKDKNKVEVVLYPFPEGIPNANSKINKACCHIPSKGSILKIEAINYKKAKVGDLVSVEYSPNSIKNILKLVGIPIFGMILGAYIKDIIGAIIGLVLGLIIGILLYKITLKEVKPIIINILKTRDELKDAVCDYDSKKNINCISCPFSCK